MPGVIAVTMPAHLHPDATGQSTGRARLTVYSAISTRYSHMRSLLPSAACQPPLAKCMNTQVLACHLQLQQHPRLPDQEASLLQGAVRQGRCRQGGVSQRLPCQRSAQSCLIRQAGGLWDSRVRYAVCKTKSGLLAGTWVTRTMVPADHPVFTWEQPCEVCGHRNSLLLLSGGACLELPQ